MTDLPKPTRPTLSPGRLLRTPAGVNEEILDAVPSERTRYTAMGGVVLGTAIMAMFSMGVALTCIFGGSNPIAYVFVPVWGLFILFLDSWLMSSPAVVRVAARLGKLIPRFLLAVAFGTIIAEPLLLGVFHTAVEQQIRDDRNTAITRYESDLRVCNPVPGTASGPASSAAKCDQLRLGVVTDSEAKQIQLDQLKQQRQDLQTTVDADTKAYANLEQKAREECNGTSGPGLTGLRGQGPNCARLRREADQYRADHRIDKNGYKLSQLNDDITKLTADVGTSRSTAADRINTGIREKVDQFRRDQAKRVGLLERLRALGELVSRNGYVRVSEWALRIFFIAVDSLPVLLKFLSGFGAYDRVAADRLQRQERAQRVVSETLRRDTVLREELDRYRLACEHAAARTKIEFDARMRHIDAEVLREDLIDARVDYLLNASSSTTRSHVPPDAGANARSGALR